MTTKDTLLLEFNRFDESTLKKLITIGDSILSPLDTELTSVDFASMIDQVFKSGGLADRYFPEWTDRSKSDFGRFLVELFAIFSDKDMFYINHFSREAFASTANTYRSIFHKAVSAALNPPSNESATGSIDLLFGAGAAVTIPRGAISIGVSAFPELTYTNKNAISVPESVAPVNVPVEFVHGTYRTTTGYFDGYSIRVQEKGIANNSIGLKINGVEWTLVNTFLNGTPSTKHFQAYYDADGSAELIFALDGLGSMPTVGTAYEVSYIVGGGYLGNILANTLDTVISTYSSRAINSFTQYAMTGGNDRPSVEALRQMVIGANKTQNRIVCSEDAMFFCRQLSFIRKVHASIFTNNLYVYVYPTAGGNLTESQKAQVTSTLNPYVMQGFNLQVSSPVYVKLDIGITIYLLPSASNSGASAIASQVLKDILHPYNNGEFGASVNIAAISSKLIQRIRGCTNVVFTTLRKQGTTTPPSDITLASSELIDFDGSTLEILVDGGAM